MLMRGAVVMSRVIVIGAGITGLAQPPMRGRGRHAVTLVDAYGPAAMASGWTLAGYRQSGRDPRGIALAREAVALWARLDEELGAPTGYRRSGNLRLARDAQEGAAHRRAGRGAIRRRAGDQPRRGERSARARAGPVTGDRLRLPLPERRAGRTARVRKPIAMPGNGWGSGSASARA